MNARIKRCAFCNGHHCTMDVNQVVYWVRCLDCGAAGPHGYTPERAVGFWNEGDGNPAALVINRQSNHHELKEVEL